MAKRKVKGKKKAKQKFDLWGNLDFDGDGVINRLDCKPLNQFEQGILHDIGKKAKSKPKFLGKIQEKYDKASPRKKKYIYGVTYKEQLAKKGVSKTLLTEKHQKKKATSKKRKQAFHKAKKETGKAIAKKYRDLQNVGIPEKYKRTRYKTVTRKYKTKSGQVVSRTVRIPIGKYGVKPNIKIHKGSSKKKSNNRYTDVDMMFGL